MAKERRKVDAEAPFQSHCKDMEKSLMFNTKGVKNFSNLTMIKDLPTETAQIIIEMIITHEQHIY